MGKTAILLGATGLTGSHLLSQLCEDERYSKIKLFSRKHTGQKHPKIEEHVGDLLDMNQFEANFTGDSVFVCIGTTKKKTPDRALYRKIDIGIPTHAAKLAKRNGIPQIAVISAIGANSKSWFIYNRIKGEMEEQVMAIGVPNTYILRPSMIAGDRKEYRSGEKVGLALFKLFGFLFVGPLKKYHAVGAADIASKMIDLCTAKAPSQIVESDAITS
jgi:uncharacterized protein YbjT (DUF2867 family)